MAHTPGPWTVDIRRNQDQFGWAHVTTEHRPIVDINLAGSDNFDGEQLANARLIAASPTLLSALEAIQSVTRDTLDTPRTSLTPFGALLAILESANAAILAAKGD